MRNFSSLIPFLTSMFSSFKKKTASHLKLEPIAFFALHRKAFTHVELNYWPQPQAGSMLNISNHPSSESSSRKTAKPFPGMNNISALQCVPIRMPDFEFPSEPREVMKRIWF